MPAILTVLVLAGSFALTFVLMRAIQRLQGSVVQSVPMPPPPRTTPPVGPDDDLAFLRELRRRIDLGHFRH